jgi:hypothetical protein
MGKIADKDIIYVDIVMGNLSTFTATFEYGRELLAHHCLALSLTLLDYIKGVASLKSEASRFLRNRAGPVFD